MMDPNEGMGVMARMLQLISLRAGPPMRPHHPTGGTSVPKWKKKARNRRRNKEARAARQHNQS